MERAKEDKIVAIPVNNHVHQLEEMKSLCRSLMATKHYAKMGEVGIFAIVQKGISLGLNPIDALIGGLYCGQGRVMMPSETMNRLIRLAGHSISKDPKSDEKVCILHGKRSDNGDTWTESFSIEDAKRAGIYKEGGTWGKYPKAMLFARALSVLARQLFPDVISGCYVEGEITESMVSKETTLEIEEEPVKYIDDEQISHIAILVAEDEEYLKKIESHFGGNLRNIPCEQYERVLKQIAKYQDNKNALKAAMEGETNVNG